LDLDLEAAETGEREADLGVGDFLLFEERRGWLLDLDLEREGVLEPGVWDLDLD